jgi:hypothetical protein
MFTGDPFQIWWFKAACYALFAAFGGTVSYLLRSIDDNKAVSWGRATIEASSAGFVGILVLLGCQAANLNEQWTGLIVGVCGWLGASATIKMLETLVRKKLGIEGNPNDPPKP